MATGEEIKDFISRWQPSGGSERSNYALFLSELCDLLEVPRPDPAKPENELNDYVIDRAVKHGDLTGTETTGFIDLYRRDCFVLETKQGVEAEEAKNPVTELKKAKRKKGHGVRGSKAWESTMLKARGQAEGYARDLPVDHGWPPFLVVVDIGYCFELYADFSGTGKIYSPYPDAQSFRIPLEALKDEAIRNRLRMLWLDPLALDPSRRTADVTREIADKLARLARTLEGQGHHAQGVAEFLMRCLFTMFAEDVRLIPENSFTNVLKEYKGEAHKFHRMATALWQTMNKGGFSPTLREDVLRFNGGLFSRADAIELNEDQLELLIEAAEADWRDVEPAIFGTLL